MPCCSQERTTTETRIIVPPVGPDLHGGAIYRIRFVCENCGAKSPWFWEGSPIPVPVAPEDDPTVAEEPEKGEEKGEPQ